MTPIKVTRMETFKERMARIRRRAGFASQGKAAAAIGCERGTVSMWEAPSSEVRAVSSDLLFRVARAYKVRPEWINDLRSKSDGYPWTPSQFGGEQSHATGPDPEIMRAAVSLFMFDADHGGLRDTESASRLLMELYRRIEAHGGALPSDEQEAFELAARERGAKIRKATGESNGDSEGKRSRKQR
jgi:hypothetical protein